MVIADKLILEWDTLFTSLNDLWEVEMQAIQMITWSTNGRRSLAAWNEVQGPMTTFKHAIQPDGSLLAELDDVVQGSTRWTANPQIKLSSNIKWARKWTANPNPS
jgi:hypothetical protein